MDTHLLIAYTGTGTNNVLKGTVCLGLCLVSSHLSTALAKVVIGKIHCCDKVLLK